MSNPYSAPESTIRNLNQSDFDQSSPFSIQGRFGRLSYLAWVFIANFTLFIIMGTISVLFSENFALMTSEQPTDILSFYTSSAGILFIVLILANLVINTIFAIRRLHDINLSGFWATLLFIPILNIIFGIFMMVKRGMLEVNQYALPRYTPTWEKVFGIICLVAMSLYLLAIFLPFILLAMSSNSY